MPLFHDVSCLTAKLNSPKPIMWVQMGITMINHPFGNGLYQLSIKTPHFGALFWELPARWRVGTWRPAASSAFCTWRRMGARPWRNGWKITIYNAYSWRDPLNMLICKSTLGTLGVRLKWLLAFFRDCLFVFGCFWHESKMSKAFVWYCTCFFPAVRGASLLIHGRVHPETESQLLIWGQKLCQGNMWECGFLRLPLSRVLQHQIPKDRAKRPFWWDPNSGISNSCKRDLLLDDGTRSCGTKAAQRQTHFLWVPFKL